jgi:carboxypeptidase D
MVPPNRAVLLCILLSSSQLWMRPSLAVRRLAHEIGHGRATAAERQEEAGGSTFYATTGGDRLPESWPPSEGMATGDDDDENYHSDDNGAANNEQDEDDEDEEEDSQQLHRNRRRLSSWRERQQQQHHRRLLGKSVDVPVPASPDNHLVNDLPLLDKDALGGTPHWAGLLPASGDGDKYLFYWMFAPGGGSKDGDTNVPLLIWLNGGPACSSMDGLWLENGPFRLAKTKDGGDWTINIDPHSWHNAPAYVVYIDQPVGTGIAFTTSGKYPTNDEKVNVDFYYFLKELLKLHGDKFLTTTTEGGKNRSTINRPFYFSGESHAGHYIPSMMNYIRKQNEKGDAEIIMSLSGAAIGNGWIDPIYQYSAQGAAYGFGLIGMAQERSLELDEEKCRSLLRQGKYVNDVCFSLLDSVINNSQGEGSKYVVSQYDQRKWEVKSKPRDFPPGHKDVEAYLGGHGSIPNADYRDVLKAIHSTPSLEAGQRYYECTDPPYNALKHQDGLGVVPDVVDLLNAGIRLLFFNGIHDLICNHVGNENAVENLPWQSQKAYQLSDRYGWMAPTTGRLGGYMKEYSNLMYLKVLDSGHMVPMDVPDIALDMIRTFMYEGSFQSYHQTINAVGNIDPSCPACPSCSSDGGRSTDNEDDDGDNCPVCEDCNKICPNRNKDDVGYPDTEAVEFSPGTIFGVGWGTIAVVSMIGASIVCWLFVLRRRSSNSRNGRSRLATRSLSPSQRQQYDMELSDTSTSATNGRGGFRDKDGYLDDTGVINGRTID